MPIVSLRDLMPAPPSPAHPEETHGNGLVDGKQQIQPPVGQPAKNGQGIGTPATVRQHPFGNTQPALGFRPTKTAVCAEAVRTKSFFTKFYENIINPLVTALKSFFKSSPSENLNKTIVEPFRKLMIDVYQKSTAGNTNVGFGNSHMRQVNDYKDEVKLMVGGGINNLRIEVQILNDVVSRGIANKSGGNTSSKSLLALRERGTKLIEAIDQYSQQAKLTPQASASKA